MILHDMVISEVIVNVIYYCFNIHVMSYNIAKTLFRLFLPVLW